MARKNTINGLINDLDFLSNNFNYLLDTKYNDIVAQLVVLIGKSTSYDTGVVRDLIANILMDLGRPDLQKELEYKMYEFWKSRTRRETEDNASYDFSLKDTRYHKHFNITIDDYGFYNQQIGKVSSIHPRNDQNVIPFNVNFYMDRLETDSEPEFIKVFNELNDLIVKLIEKGV